MKPALLVLVVLVLQASLVGEIRVAEARPDLMLLVPIAAGIVAGPERGAVLGFMAGIVADLFLLAPLGLSALTFSIVGFAVGLAQGNVIRSAWWIAPITALVASAGGVVLYAVIGAVVGHPGLVRLDLLPIAAGVAVVNGVLSIPVVRVAAWAVSQPGTAARVW